MSARADGGKEKNGEINQVPYSAPRGSLFQGQPTPLALEARALFEHL